MFGGLGIHLYVYVFGYKQPLARQGLQLGKLHCM